MKTNSIIGRMVEYAPGTEHHCVGVVLGVFPMCRDEGKLWDLKCLWDDGTIEGINSELVSLVERVK